ncbi:MAG: VanZ family protein [Ignavibacteriaceae bacterium]
MFDFIEKNKGKLLYIPLVIYWLVLLVLTTLPGKELPKTGINDKIEHFTAYFLLGILLSLTLLFQNKFSKIKKYFTLFTGLIIGLYAALDEIHQLFIPGRNCDILDWTADMIGASIGILVIIFLIKILQYSQKSQLN